MQFAWNWLVDFFKVQLQWSAETCKFFFCFILLHHSFFWSFFFRVSFFLCSFKKFKVIEYSWLIGTYWNKVTLMKTVLIFFLYFVLKSPFFLNQFYLLLFFRFFLKCFFFFSRFWLLYILLYDCGWVLYILLFFSSLWLRLTVHL